MVRLLEKRCSYKYTITTIPGSFNWLADHMSKIPHKHKDMPEAEPNIPYRGQVRWVTQGNRGSIRINRVLMIMACNGRKGKKYQQCIDTIKLGRSPKEIEEENPDHPFL